MKKILSQTILILLLLLALLGGAGWFYADQLLNDVARPQLAKYAAALLQAEVQIDALKWTDSGLELHDLNISAADRLRVKVPQLSVDFTLGSLWHRQLEAVRIISPEVETFPTPPAANKSATPFSLPLKLPLWIKQLRVTDGQLQLFSAGQLLQFQQLNFSGSLQEKSEFQLAAFFGDDETQPFTISGTGELSPQPRLTIESFFWQQQPLLSSPVSIQLEGTELSLGSSTFKLQQFDDQKLRALLSALGQAEMLPAPLAFSLTEISINFALHQQSLQLELQIDSGQFRWEQINSTISATKIQLNQSQDGWQIEGQLQGPAETRLELSGKLDDNHQLSGQAVLQIPTPGQLKAELFGGPDLPVSGGLHLTAEFALHDEQLKVSTKIQGQPSVQLKSNYLLNFGQLSGHASLLRSDQKEELALNLKLADRPFFSASGDFNQLKFALADSDLQTIRTLLAPQQVPEQLKAVNRLAAKGQLSRKDVDWSGDFSLTAEQISLSELTLKQLTAHSKLQFSARGLNFSKAGFDVALQSGKELNAQLHAEAAGSYSAQQLSLQLQQFELSQVNYISADEQTGVGAAALKLQGDISGPLPTGPLALSLNGTAAAAEVLAGQFYADLSPYRADFFCAGHLSPQAGNLQLDTFQLRLPKFGSLSATGQLSPQQIKLQATFAVSDLAESFGEHLRPMLSGTYPPLTELSLQGKIALSTNLLWTPDGWQSRGMLQPEGIDAYWQRQQLQMVDGSGSIPFALSSVNLPAETEAVPEQTGTISFGSLSAGLATLEEGQLQLAAANNRFSIRSPLLLQLAGGRVAVENLSVDWSEGTPQGSVKINISNVELESLTTKLRLPVMQGQLRADLGTIRYRNRQLSSDGLVNIEVFGGRFQLRNLHYSEPFSSYPTFHADIDFSDLDLLQTTRTFDFGEMNGVLDGQIHGLELFGRTPAAFIASLNTRQEGKRNISVKALNNLSILSQGGISAALSRGVYRFIDFYRYRQIGFKCSLENDTFTLLGTAIPGSQRYLVDGGLLPPRIDITTTSPTISFKEMLKRLGRLDRAGK